MRHRLFIPAATALLFALAACTQDELAGDNRLPEGECPVVIRATGLSVEATPLAAPSTRASVDGDWQANRSSRWNSAAAPSTSVRRTTSY